MLWDNSISGTLALGNMQNTTKGEKGEYKGDAAAVTTTYAATSPFIAPGFRDMMEMMCHHYRWNRQAAIYIYITAR